MIDKVKSMPLSTAHYLQVLFSIKKSNETHIFSIFFLINLLPSQSQCHGSRYQHCPLFALAQQQCLFPFIYGLICVRRGDSALADNPQKATALYPC